MGQYERGCGVTSAEQRGPSVCNVSFNREGKDEMTKASIDLQDLRRRLYVKRLMKLDRVAKAIVQHKTRVIDIDLRSYFDNVRHDRLLAKVARRVDDPDVMHLLKIS
jgi:hypothetical protein